MPGWTSSDLYARGMHDEQPCAVRRELREFLRDACLAARVLHKGPREPPLETNHGPLLCAEEIACG